MSGRGRAGRAVLCSAVALVITGVAAAWATGAVAQPRVLPNRPVPVWRTDARMPAATTALPTADARPAAPAAAPGPATVDDPGPQPVAIAAPQQAPVAPGAQAPAPPAPTLSAQATLPAAPAVAAPGPAAVALTTPPPLPARPDVPRAAGSFVPTRLLVPSIGTDAPVTAIGLSDTLALEVPADPGLLGWWDGGARAGDPVGTVSVTGHVSWGGIAGALHDLTQLSPGDSAWLIGPDGSGVEYVTQRLDSYLKSALPAAEIFDDTVAGRLVLITCGGAIDATGHHDSNVVAYLIPVGG